MAAMQTQARRNGDTMEAQRMISRAEANMLQVLKRRNAKTREGTLVVSLAATLKAAEEESRVGIHTFSSSFALNLLA